MNEKAENQSSNTDNSTGLPGRRKPGTGKGLLVIGLVFLALILLTRREAIHTIDCTPEIMLSKPDVIMLGAWWCSYCRQAKQYFQNNNIHYCEYDVETTKTGKQLYQQHGEGAIPILLIGKYQLSGFNEQQIETALSLLKNRQNVQP